MKNERSRPEGPTSPEPRHRPLWDIAAVALLGPVLGMAGSWIGRVVTPDNLIVGELVGLLAGVACTLAMVFALRRIT